MKKDWAIEYVFHDLYFITLFIYLIHHVLENVRSCALICRVLILCSSIEMATSCRIGSGQKDANKIRLMTVFSLEVHSYLCFNDINLINYLAFTINT
jgi:hypothetical protein